MDPGYVVEAVLKARDDGYSKTFEQLKKNTEQAASGVDRFKETFKGMTSATLVTQGIAKAWNMVKDSIGRAMSRIDTMNQFNRVMTSMTGDVRASENALNDLNVASRGTAYGLDTMASATQGLVTSGIELKDSTKYVARWGDAIALYGDGSNQTFSRVMEQMAQMAASGRANFGDIKSATTAGIPVLNLYAEATNKSITQVRDDITKGKVTSNEFFKAMDKAFTEGTKSFPPLVGAAKEAGSSWSATFDNMKAATARGTLSIIQSIEQARSDAQLPGMKDAVAGFGKFLEKTLNAISKVTGFVARNFKELAIATLAAGATFKAFKHAEKAMSWLDAFGVSTEKARALIAQLTTAKQMNVNVDKLYNAAIKDTAGAETIAAAAKKLNIALTEKDKDGIEKAVELTKEQKYALLEETGALTLKAAITGAVGLKAKIAAAAQWLWNKAMAANPIGMVVAGVGLLVGGLTKLVSWLNRTSAEHKKANEEAQKMADANKSLADSVSSLGNTFQSTKSDIEANQKQGQSLVDELKRLERSTMGAAEKQRRMKMAVDDLNKLYPELNVQLDKTGTAIKGGTEAIEEQIKANAELAKAEAQKEYLKEQYKTQIELRNQMDQTKRKMEEMKAAGHDTEGLFNSTSKGYKELQQSLADCEVAYDDITESIKVTEEAVSVANEDQLKQIEIQETQARSLESLQEKYGVTTTAIVDYANKTGEALENVGAKILELSETYGVSTDEIIASCNAQGITLEEWAVSHEELTKRAEEALKQHEKAVDDFVSITTSGFERLKQNSAISLAEYEENLRRNREATQGWADNINTLMQAGVDAGIIRELEKMGPAGAEQAAAFVAELEKLNGGALGKFEDLSEGARERIEGLGEVFQEGLDVANEAANTRLEAQNYSDIGRKAVQQILDGIDEQKAAMEAAGVTTIDELYLTLDENAKNKAFRGTGKIVTTDIADGIKSSSGIVNDAGKMAVRDLSKTTETAVKSQNFRISGQQAMTDFQKGIDASTATFNLNVLKSKFSQSFRAISDIANTNSVEISRKTVEQFTEMNASLTRLVDTLESKIAAKLGGIVTVYDRFNTSLVPKLDDIVHFQQVRMKSLANVYQETGNKMKSHISAGINGASTALAAGGSKLTANSRDINRGVVGQFSGLSASMRSVGVNAGQGLYNGLSSMQWQIYRLAGRIASNTASQMRRALKIQSPSKVTSDIGINTGRGFAEGLNQSMRGVKAAATDLAQSAIVDIPKTDMRIGQELPDSTVNATGQKPQVIYLNMFGKTLRAVVDGLTHEQNKNLELMEVYGV